MADFPVLNKSNEQLLAIVSDMDKDIEYIPSWANKQALGVGTDEIALIEKQCMDWYDGVSVKMVAGGAITSLLVAIIGACEVFPNSGVIGWLIGFFGSLTFTFGHCLLGTVLEHNRWFKRRVCSLVHAWKLRRTSYTHADVMTAVEQGQWDHPALPYVMDNPTHYTVLDGDQLDALNEEVAQWDLAPCSEMWTSILRRGTPVRQMDAVLLRRLQAVAAAREALAPALDVMKNLVAEQQFTEVDVVLIENDPQGMDRQRLAQQWGQGNHDAPNTFSKTAPLSL